MKRILSMTLACLLASASVAVAGQSVAVVQGVGGKVMVNKGKGFVPVVGSMNLSAGDAVLIGNESSATLAYTDCAVELKKPAVVKIGKAAPCAASEKTAGGVFVMPTADVPDAVAAAPFPWPALLLIGGAAAVTTAIVVGTKNDKNPAPAPVTAP